jgi:hypothetical protein
VCLNEDTAIVMVVLGLVEATSTPIVAQNTVAM